MTRTWLLVAAVAGGVLLVVAVAVGWLVTAHRQHEQQRLALIASSLHSELQGELERISDLGTGIAVTVADRAPIDRAGYAAVVEDLQVAERFPAVGGTAYLEQVPRAGLDDWLAQRAAEGDGFMLHPDAGQPQLRLIRYTEPQPLTAPSLGVDVSRTPGNLRAFDLAQRSGRPRLTPAVQLSSLPEGEAGAVLYAPVPRSPDRLPAAVAVALSLPGLLASLEPLPDDVVVRLHDPDSELFPRIAAPGTDPDADDGGRAAVEVAQIGLADRSWILEVAPGDDFTPAWERSSALALLAMGLALAASAAVLAHSLSARERTAQQLAQARTADLARSAEELARANAELVEADHHKDAFLAAVSHELRTPLAVISGFLESLRRIPSEQVPTETLLEPMERNVRRLDVLVGDLLTLASLDAGALHSAAADVQLATAVTLVTADHTDRDGRGVEVDVPDELWANVDPRHLDRILTNLVVNASTHGEGPIQLGAAAEGDEVRLWVRDHGSGLAADDAARVFDRFERGTHTDRSTGTGLGLAIVRELTLAAGGQLAYRPADPGACFEVRLPAAGPRA